MYIAIVTTNAETAKPTAPVSHRLAEAGIVPSLKVVNMVEVSVSIDTQADAKLIALDAENTGLLYFLYFTMLTIAAVNDAKVYAAMAIVVIMW